MHAFSGLCTSTRIYTLLSTAVVPRDVGWNSGPWALRLGYCHGLTRDDLDAMDCGLWIVKDWIGGQVFLRVEYVAPDGELREAGRKVMEGK